jgi:hypothetical protein
MPELLGRKPVDVADARARRHPEGLVESAELETVAAQIAPGHLPTDGPKIGSQPELLPGSPDELAKGCRRSPQGFVSDSTPTAVPLGFKVIV